ncbi:MAG TPA: lipase maturation factor family protein [Terriglobia bacterium]|nr:lipase maturation factor family protein [Terriglobia bacterium]
MVAWLFGPGPRERHLWPRWLFLRGLGLIFFSAFYSLLFQIRGLIGPQGILPAGPYLQEVAQQLGGAKAFWYAPTVYWLDSSGRAMMLVTILGLAASIALVLNLWPRGALAVCLISYLSFVAAAQDFSSYQSDGMLLATGFVSLFFAPPGLRPGLGEGHPPSRATHFLLLWEWFRIYFESGFVKLASHDVEWRNLTALDQYYSNGPLPNWIGWYVQQAPHMVHAVTAFVTLFTELAIPFMMFLPRRYRIICFFIVTPFQVGIILTANLAFINHLALLLGILLVDDQFLRGVCGSLLRRFEIGNWKLEKGKSKFQDQNLEFGERYSRGLTSLLEKREAALAELESKLEIRKPKIENGKSKTENGRSSIDNRQSKIHDSGSSFVPRHLSLVLKPAALLVSSVLLTWVFYASTFLLLQELIPGLGYLLPTTPVAALEPFRIANQYGLFAVMTRNRYEIEFQGSRDGVNWQTYPFRYKPQDPARPPGWYAPYQPRFDWNLWFASLVPWRQSPILIGTEERLLENSHDVLALFAANPFADSPPRYVRAVMWQYWFTDLATKHRTGLWWDRKMLGLFAPEMALRPDGRFGIVQMPADNLPPPESPYEP